jgi:hypothetical protein
LGLQASGGLPAGKHLMGMEKTFYFGEKAWSKRYV